MSRILFTVEHLDPFGPARRLFPLVRALVQQGQDVAVMVLGAKALHPQPWLETGVRLFFANPDDSTPLHPTRDALALIGELRWQLQIIDPDVVHAWCGEAIWMTLLATQAVPGTTLPDFRLLATELNLPSSTSLFRRWCAGRLARRLELLLVSHQVVADRLESQGFADVPYRILPAGISVGDFEPDRVDGLSDPQSPQRPSIRSEVRRQLGLDEADYLAVAIAPLEPKYRLKDLVWATDMLTCIRDDLHFVLIGSGSQEARLDRFAGLTEAHSHVHLVGRPERQDSILAAADVVWHSHLQSPHSDELVTGMAMGIPVISAWGAGTEDWVRHQQTGLAVNYGARDEFSRWTKYVIEMPEAAAQLGRQARSLVRRQGMFTQVADDWTGVYENFAPLRPVRAR